LYATTHRKLRFEWYVPNFIHTSHIDMSNLQLQRVGRTGRKREGFVHVLLSEGREESNLDKAKATYKDVQFTIARGNQLELYSDVERLLPDHMKPECLEKVMEIEEYVREEGKPKPSSGKRAAEPKKRKRNDDMGRNIPEGASTGFVSAANLVVKGAKKVKISEKNFEVAGLDDDVDLDLEAGTILAPPRRTVSTSAATAKTPKAKPLRRAATTATKEPKKKAPKKTARPVPALSQQEADDSDNKELEKVVSPVRRKKVKVSPKNCPPSPELSVADAVIELSSDDGHNFSSPPSLHAGDHRSKASSSKRSIAWLVDEDDDPDIEIVNSSPTCDITSHISPSRIPLSPTAASVGSYVSPPPPNQSARRALNSPKRRLQSPSQADDDAEVPVSCIYSSPAKKSPSSSPLWRLSSSPQKAATSPTMPSPVFSEHNIPEPTFPVRQIGKRSKQRTVRTSPTQSIAPETPSPPKRRLKRRTIIESSPDQQHSSSPAPRKKKKVMSAEEMKEWIALEAEHSGDEVSSGSSHGEDDVESESDRQFLQELPSTQIPQSYDQTLAYRQSLLTQAPCGSKVPVFANGPVRRGPFGGGRATSPRQRGRFVPSSPADDDENEYAFGSFVVEDDAEISFVEGSSEV
jgi:ATP-dependent DNA helicase MPH1